MSFNFGNTVTNDFSTFSDDEKLNYSLKLALNRVQTWGKTPWYEEPSVLTSTFPNLTLKNKIPESSEIETYYIVDPDLGKATDRNVLKAIASNDYNALTINTIDDSTHNSNPPIRTQSEKQTVNVTNGDTTKTLLKGISKTMIAKYIYWKNYLTGKVTKSDGTTVTDSTSGTGTGTYPDKTAPFASFMTLSNSSGDYYVNDRRVSTIKEGGTYETLFNNLETLYSGLEIIHWSNIENDGTAPPSKRHPFFKVFIGLPTYSTYSDALKEKFNDIGVGSSQSGDNIGFSNRLLERAMGSINGYKFYISTWNKKTSKFKQKKEDTYGDPNNLNILYFLSYSGFILNYGETDILNGKDATIDDASISIKYPPTISFIKYTGETFSDGIISQGETLPAPEVSLPKDLFINTSDDTIYRYNGSAWVSVGGGGGGSINELSDALVIQESIYLGNPPDADTLESAAQYNVAVGTTALDAITTGNNNVAVGYNALTSNTTGYNNTASGSNALYENIEGVSNTAIGYHALFANKNSSYNTACGWGTLTRNITGKNNTASGYSALFENTTGKNNTASGYYALYNNQTGSNNTAIGYDADVTINNLTNATAIGYNAKVTTSDTIQLGNSSLKYVKTSGTITARNVEIENNCFIGAKAPTTEKKVLTITAGTREISIGGNGNNTLIQAHATGDYDTNAILTITGHRVELFGNNDKGMTVLEDGSVQASGTITAGSVSSSGTITASSVSSSGNITAGSGSSGGTITAPESKFGDISIHKTNEINSDSLLYLQYRNNRNVDLCRGGGKVGIGVAPNYKLDVDGDIRSFGWLRTNGNTGWYSNSYGGGWRMTDTSWIRSYGSMAVYISGSTSLSWNGYYWSEKSQNYFNGNSNVSLECKHAIVCDWIGANSDRRIKKNIEDIDDGDALKILRKIPVRYYNYIDEMKKGSEKVAGFIAQEVKEHFPIAVSISPYDKAIPNILKKIKNEVWEEKVNETSKNEWILTNFDVIDLNGVISSIDISSNSKYKFFLNDGKDSKEEEIEVLADTDGSFTFEKKWENLFLYGICIDDFHVVHKNKIFAIGFSATQEIDRIQQVEKQKLEELASKITVAESKIATLEAENILLKSRLDSIEAKLQ